jgi:hypothetical protein
VGLGGLEPPTSRLSGVRSNQLSYRPTPRDDAEEIEPVETVATPLSPSLTPNPHGPEPVRARTGRYEPGWWNQPGSLPAVELQKRENSART